MSISWQVHRNLTCAWNLTWKLLSSYYKFLKVKKVIILWIFDSFKYYVCFYNHPYIPVQGHRPCQVNDYVLQINSLICSFHFTYSMRIPEELQMTLWSLICADPVDIDLPVHSCKTLWLFNDGSKVFQESLWPSHPKRKSEQNFEQAELLQELSPGAQQPFINSCIFMNAGSFVWWLRILVSQEKQLQKTFFHDVNITEEQFFQLPSSVWWG